MSLKNGGAGLAVVDSTMASLLMVRAYDAKEMYRIDNALFKIEKTQEYGIKDRWDPSSVEYKAGFEVLRRRSLTRYVGFGV